MSFSNNYDSIEQLIFETGLRITSVSFLENLMIITLNTNKTLSFLLSNYKLLLNATETQLNHYKLINNGVGIHWPELDEDLSLKGFLKEELKKLTGVNNQKPDGSGGSPQYAIAA